MQFTKESGNSVEECKLRVVYAPPPRPPSPVREGSEEGSSPRASLSENGALSSSEKAAVSIFLGGSSPGGGEEAVGDMTMVVGIAAGPEGAVLSARKVNRGKIPPLFFLAVPGALVNVWPRSIYLSG